VRFIKDCVLYSFSGATLDELTVLIKENPEIVHNYDTILVHCGTNNLLKDDATTIISKTKLIVHEIKNANPMASILVSDILSRPKDHVVLGQKVININNNLRWTVPSWGCHLVASHKFTFRNRQPIADLFEDGLHLNRSGTLKLRQFLSQRLSEHGVKPNGPRQVSIYLKRFQWSKNIKNYIVRNY
jgi:hypothetical protein